VWGIIQYQVLVVSSHPFPHPVPYSFHFRFRSLCRCCSGGGGRCRRRSCGAGRGRNSRADVRPARDQIEEAARALARGVAGLARAQRRAPGLRNEAAEVAIVGRTVHVRTAHLHLQLRGRGQAGEEDNAEDDLHHVL